MKKLIRYFFQGILYLAPATITIYIVYMVFNVLDRFIQGFFEEFISFHIPGLGIVAVVILITLLGFLGQTFIFRPVQKLAEKALESVPLIKVIYSSIKDLLSAFVGRDRKFNQVVLVKVNMVSDLEKMGFITQSDLKELYFKDKIVVYFPHSYNFSGEMFIVPKEHVTILNIPASEAMKFIVSGGASKGW